MTFAILFGFIVGMLPKSKVNPRLVEKFVAQERDNRRKLLQTYVEACSAAKVHTNQSSYLINYVYINLYMFWVQVH